MSAAQRKRQNQVKTARLEIVARLYKRGYSVRQIRQEVMTRLTLPSYSLGTVHKDISTLLEEWRDNRLGDMNDALQLELERIDETCRELWAQWEKSKEDYNKTTNTRKGAPSRNKETGANTVKTYSIEERTSNIIGLGNPQYIAEIRQQLAERRKLLGLYAATKTEVTGKNGSPLIPVEMMTEEQIRAEINRIQASMNS